VSPQEPISAVPPPADVAEEEVQAGPNLEEPQFYFNRELSWLDFNERVLQLAEDASVPLMERLKFAAIFTSNLDEFFMIRVAGLHDQVDAGLSDPGPDGRTPSQVIDELRDRIVELNERLTACFQDHLGPELSEHDICIMHVPKASSSGRRHAPQVLTASVTQAAAVAYVVPPHSM